VFTAKDFGSNFLHNVCNPYTVSCKQGKLFYGYNMHYELESKCGGRVNDLVFNFLTVTTKRKCPHHHSDGMSLWKV